MLNFIRWPHAVIFTPEKYDWKFSENSMNVWLLRKMHTDIFWTSFANCLSPRSRHAYKRMNFLNMILLTNIT